MPFVLVPLVLLDFPTMPSAGPDMPLWEPPQGKDAYGCKVAILEGNAW